VIQFAPAAKGAAPNKGDELDSAGRRIVQRLDREVAEGALEALYLLDVVAAGAPRNPELKFSAFLKAKQQRQQYTGPWPIF